MNLLWNNKCLNKLNKSWLIYNKRYCYINNKLWLIYNKRYCYINKFIYIQTEIKIIKKKKNYYNYYIN